jgi:hypothetical protein
LLTPISQRQYWEDGAVKITPKLEKAGDVEVALPVEAAERFICMAVELASKR